MYKFVERMLKIIYSFNMDEFLAEFGANIKLYRKQLGLSQEKLGELSGLSTNTVSTLEKGKSFVKYSSLEGLVKALGITVFDLFNFARNNNSDKYLHQIILRAKKLSTNQKKQIVKILDSFE